MNATYSARRRAPRSIAPPRSGGLAAGSKGLLAPCAGLGPLRAAVGRGAPSPAPALPQRSPPAGARPADLTAPPADFRWLTMCCVTVYGPTPSPSTHGGPEVHPRWESMKGIAATTTAPRGRHATTDRRRYDGRAQRHATKPASWAWRHCPAHQSTSISPWSRARAWSLPTTSGSIP